MGRPRIYFECKVDGCPRPYNSNGFCVMHPKRFQRNGDPGEVGSRLIRERPPGMKWCPRCEDFVPEAAFYPAKSRSDGLSGLCIRHTNEHTQRSAAARRDACIDTMGAVCVHCGFDRDRRALQIDHVHGGGSSETRLLGSNTKKFYDKVLANPADYQILCANCNTIKRVECGEHHHSERLEGLSF